MSESEVPEIVDRESEGVEPAIGETETDAEPMAIDSDTDPDEIELDEIELSDDDLGGESVDDDLFSGVEGSQKDTGETDETAGEQPGDETDETADARPMPGIAQSVNEGAARIGVSGLPDDQKEDLQGELSEIFEAFHLGFFAEEFTHEYILSGEEEIDPTWGLIGSALVCGIFTLHLRPDGDEKIAKLRRSVDRMGSGVGGTRRSGSGSGVSGV